MEKQKKTVAKKNSLSSIMSKNVTQFQHFLKHNHITQNDIGWAINLRSYNRNSSLHKNKQQNIPQVYYKLTKIQQIRNTININQQNGVKKPALNMGQFSYLTNRINDQTYSSDTMNYHIGLGNGSSKNEPNKAGAKFWNLPYKDRKQFPKLLKKENLKKSIRVNQSNLQSAFDGSQNYPNYTQKILNERNISNLEHLVKAKNNLPNIAWHVSLRNYA